MSRSPLKLRSWVIGAAAVVAALSVSPADAAALSVNSWTVFNFGNTGSALSDEVNGDTSFTTDRLSSNAILEVSDAFYPGDIFDISINGGTPIPTSTPPCSGYTCLAAPEFTGTNYVYVGMPLTTVEIYDTAFTDGLFSTLSIVLAAGSSYTITGTALFALEPGMGAFNLVETPLPPAWTLMLVGLFGLCWVCYRRSTRNPLPIAVS
jgi:hypothetical protein